MKENISESIADNFSLPVSDTKYSELITLIDFLTWYRGKKMKQVNISISANKTARRL